MNEQQRAVVQQALEALKGLYAITEIAQEDIDCRFAWAEMPDAKEAITALRQLLEPEPVFCEYCGGNDDADFGLPTDHCTDCARPQPEQLADHSEQDLDMVENGDLLTIVYMDGLHTGKRMAKREWVELSRDEVLDIEETTNHPLEFYRAISDKLKEKNT